MCDHLPSDIRHPLRSAFTLIEMAIVLTVIGLIVGGVLAGQSMVRTAELRDVVTEYDTYLKSIKEFQDKYLALPGDMNNAAGIWATTASGDGNGTIGTSGDDSPADTLDASNTYGEWYLAWQQLALAGFIPGSYTGQPGANGANESVIGTNVPASKLPGAGWTINYYVNNADNAGGLWPSNTSTVSNPYGHTLNFGGYVSGDYTKGTILIPSEAQDLDAKLDDGMPSTGTIRAWRNEANCIVGGLVASQTGDTYSTVFTGQACSLVFLLGF